MGESVQWIHKQSVGHIPWLHMALQSRKQDSDILLTSLCPVQCYVTMSEDKWATVARGSIHGGSFE